MPSTEFAIANCAREIKKQLEHSPQLLYNIGSV